MPTIPPAPLDARRDAQSLARRAARLIAGFCLAAALGAPTSAQRSAPSADFEPPADVQSAIETLNRRFERIPASDRAESVLLPALAKMAKAPAGVAGRHAAAMLSPADGAWSAAAAWAEAPEQQAVVEALKQITEPGTRFLFAMPYGAAAPQEHRDAGFGVELGEPPLLARARHGSLDAFTRLGELVNVEATRLADSGDVHGGVDLMLRWVRFGRMIIERDFLVEKLWGFRTMRDSLERMRDILYTHPDTLTDDQLREFIEAIPDRELAIERILLPGGERVAALQMITATISRRAGPNPDSFGPTLASLASSDRPLRLFGQAARYQKIAETHADWFVTSDELRNVYEDWRLRWSMGPHDPVLTGPTDYELSDPARFALIKEVVPDIGAMFEQRILLRTETAGTRLSLGVLAYKARFRNWPRPLFAIRGSFVREIDVDPFDPDGIRAFSYFVPIRDQPQDARRDPVPHTISVSWSPAGAAASAPSGSGDAKRNAMLAVVDQMMQSTPPQQLRQNVEQLLRTLDSENVTADNIEQHLDLFSGQPMSSRAEVSDSTIAALKAFLNNPELKSAVDKMRSGQSITDAEVTSLMRTMFISMQGATTTAEAAEAPTGDAIQFTVDLDDSGFVLYSTGRDNQADWSTKVGHGGSDLLIWPPIISLVREHLASGG